MKFLIDADTGIFDKKFQKIVFQRIAKLNFPAGGEFQRVGQNIFQDMLQLEIVGVDFRLVVRQPPAPQSPTPSTPQPCRPRRFLDPQSPPSQ